VTCAEPELPAEEHAIRSYDLEKDAGARDGNAELFAVAVERALSAGGDDPCSLQERSRSRPTVLPASGSRFFHLPGSRSGAHRRSTDGKTLYLADGNRGDPLPYNRIRIIKLTPRLRGVRPPPYRAQTAQCVTASILAGIIGQGRCEVHVIRADEERMLAPCTPAGAEQRLVHLIRGAGGGAGLHRENRAPYEYAVLRIADRVHR
jgi:hypothetical protein